MDESNIIDLEEKIYERESEMDRSRRENKIYKDKMRGSILGFAIGDAMGAPVEFSKEKVYLTKFIDSPKKGLKAGQFTDDTQHLEIALDSLLISEKK